MEPVVPAPFSAQWMREKLPVLRDRALQDPTPQNVRAYFYLQRHAMNMAERFALTAQSIVLTDPLLDENSRRPISTYGGQVFDAVARENTVRIATKIASDAGVWYFYRSDCEFCRAQNPVLDRLRRRIGLAILPIALDGRAMPEEPFARYVPNRGHAQQLGVNRTPTLFLVREPDQFIRLSEGFVTDDGLLERLIHVAYQAGWISEAEFQSTRAATPPPQNILTQAVDPSAHEDSVTLVDVLRAQESNAEAGLVP
jgi:conjugal transfer pilus assembly protein TraF